MGPMNIGNPVEYTIKQLAETVQGMVDPSVPITYKPIPSDDPRKRKPDITLAMTHLKWQPRYKLRGAIAMQKPLFFAVGNSDGFCSFCCCKFAVVFS